MAATKKKAMKYSPSSIDLFRKCPWAFKMVKVEYVAREETEALVIGRMIHELIETYLNALYAAGLDTDWKLAESLTPKAGPTDVPELWEWFWQRYVRPAGVEDAGVEKKLAFNKKWAPCKWDAKGAHYRLVIDHHFRQDDLAVIEDWKTGWVKPDNLEKDLQTRSYGWALRQGVYRGVPHVLLRHQYIRFKKWPVEILLDAADLDTVPEEVGAEIAKIEAERHFDPAPGNFCSWCGVQAHCPAVSKALVPADVMLPTTMEQAQKAAGLLLAVKEAEKVLYKGLREWVSEQGPITVGDLVFGPKDSVSYSPDPEAVVDILLNEAGLGKEQVWPMLSATKTNLTRGLKKAKRLDLLDRLLGTGTSKSSTTIDFRKAVGGDNE